MFVIYLLDFQEYIRACESHLDAEQTQPDESKKPYYKKVDEDTLEEIRVKVNQIVEEAFDNDIISKEEYDAINASFGQTD